MTADEFLAFCDTAPDNRRYELIRGEVAISPLPTRPQGVIAAQVSSGFSESARTVGYPAIGVGILLGRNPDTVRVPPVALFAGSCVFEELENGFSEELPLLVVLIDTDDATVSDYLSAGVPTVWVLNSSTRNLTEHGKPAPCAICYNAADFFRLPNQPPPSP